MKIRLIFALIFFVFSLTMPSKVLANDELREEIFQVLQEGFRAQVSLSEEKRDLAEVYETLAPYFTKQTASDFLEENLYEKNGKYFTLGSDFALYYIPFFTYSEETKIKTGEDSLFVYEFFPEISEGIVTYKSHYQGILLVREQEKWKISEFYYNVDPENLLEMQFLKNTPKEEKPKSTRGAENFELVLKLILNPLESFLDYGNAVLITFLKGEGSGQQ